MKNENLIKIAKTHKKKKHTKKINSIILPIETLEFFLDYFGMINSRTDLELTLPIQKHISKIIRRLRYYGFIPFTMEEIVFDEEEDDEDDNLLLWENI